MEKILIVVKTAPQPSVNYREVVCTAGVTESGKWVRLYPINFRYLDFYKQYKKYQWIKVEVTKNRKDKRVDSYRPDLQTLKIIGEPLPAGNWQERKKIVLPTVVSSLEEIKENYEKNLISLGAFKPKEVSDFIIEADDKDWGKKHKEILSQMRLFGEQPKRLKKVPFKFRYKFRCNDSRCNGHVLQIIDWEVYRLYLKLKKQVGFSMDTVLEKLKQKWLDEMWAENRDSYLMVGSVYPYPTFVILGVFWPPKESQLSLI